MAKTKYEQRRRERQMSDPAVYQAYLDRKRAWREQNPQNSEYERSRKAAWRARNPEINRRIRQAGWTVDNAVRRGRLVRGTHCHDCGTECETQAHHESYEREHWLDVIWLCGRCHSRRHHPCSN